MTSQSFCIHGHFYQPPREDPLTGAIPIEPGASPFPNWNERIHAECYRPNAELGNFAHISFNIGPTLLEWMNTHDHAILQGILAQDQANMRAWGVGNAMAQAFNHTILPLASYEDKVTQVAWGIAEFRHRFGRKPQGMWLPETAVDLETLQVLAEQGIQFTILAPWQAEREDVDVTEPYRVALPGGRSITVFFYHSGLSGGISFNPAMTVNADSFALYDLSRHFNAEKIERGEPQIILVASDGELYGHHQPMRDRFLERLVDGASTSLGFNPTYPALWLQQNPIRREIKIRENTSWSCHHGVVRWSGSCGCSPRSGEWKAQLRQAFERLSMALDDLYAQFMRPYIDDPWALRNRYIEVMMGLLPVEDLLAEMAGQRLPTEVNVRLHLLLEMERERQRIYTSCGWFFDDFDRIEPKNSIAYAAQAVRLLRLATGVNLERYVVEDLQGVASERTGLSAGLVFQRHMQRAVLDGRVIAGARLPYIPR